MVKTGKTKQKQNLNSEKDLIKDFWLIVRNSPRLLTRYMVTETKVICSALPPLQSTCCIQLCTDTKEPGIQVKVEQDILCCGSIV